MNDIGYQKNREGHGKAKKTEKDMSDIKTEKGM